MEISPRQQQAISALKNRLQTVPNLEQEIIDDIFSSMILDWINNASPNEVGIETTEQMKELVEGDHPGLQLDNEQSTELLNTWLEFVAAFYAVNGGKRKKMRKTRKSKKRSKKTRKH